MPLDVILNFEDREKWAIPFTEIGEQWASSSRYGFEEGLYQPTKNNGVILIFTDTDEEGRMGCRIEIIPKLTQLLWNAKIQQKQNRNRPKTEEEKELFSLMFTLYADKLFWSNHPEHIDLMIDEEEDDLLDTEPIYGGGTLRPRGSIRKQIAHIIDKAFQEKNLDIIKKIAPFYESILELVESDFYLHYLTSRPDDRDIRVLHSLVPNTSKQFLRLTTIIKEHLIEHYFELPTQNDIIKAWRKKYPCDKRKTRRNKSWSDDNKDSEIFEKDDGTAISKLHDVLKRWGFLWLIKDVPWESHYAPSSGKDYFHDDSKFYCHIGPVEDYEIDSIANLLFFDSKENDL